VAVNVSQLGCSYPDLAYDVTELAVMVKRVRASSLVEFELAASNGCVFGRWLKLYVYVELGAQGEYRESEREEQSTRRKLFRNCTVYYAETEEQIDNEDYAYDSEEDILIVYW